MAILSILLTTIIIIVSILIVLIVLVQRPKQEGLGASFGSSTFDSTLGAGATDFLQKLTTYLGIIFFVSAIALSIVKARQFGSTASRNAVDKVIDKDDPIMNGTPAPSSVPKIETNGNGLDLNIPETKTDPGSDTPPLDSASETPAVETPVTPVKPNPGE